MRSCWFKSFEKKSTNATNLVSPPEYLHVQRQRRVRGAQANAVGIAVVAAQTENFELTDEWRMFEGAKAVSSDAVVAEVEFAKADEVAGGGEGAGAGVAGPGAAQIQSFEISDVRRFGEEADALIAQEVVRQIEIGQLFQDWGGGEESDLVAGRGEVDLADRRFGEFIGVPNEETGRDRDFVREPAAEDAPIDQVGDFAEPFIAMVGQQFALAPLKGEAQRVARVQSLELTLKVDEFAAWIVLFVQPSREPFVGVVVVSVAKDVVPVGIRGNHACATFQLRRGVIPAAQEARISCTRAKVKEKN